MYMAPPPHRQAPHRPTADTYLPALMRSQFTLSPRASEKSIYLFIYIYILRGILEIQGYLAP